jgi:hypothetical protein
MQLTAWLALALSGVVTASTQDAPAINVALRILTPALQDLDRSIAAITAKNVKTQMEDVKAKAVLMNTAQLQAAARLKGTAPLKGVSDGISLLSSGTAYLRAANKTLGDIQATKNIVLKAKLDHKVKEALIANKPGIIAMIEVGVKQIPPNLIKAPSGAVGAKDGRGAGLPPTLPSGPELEFLLDGAIDRVMEVFRGEAKLSDLGAFGATGGAGGLGGLDKGGTGLSSVSAAPSKASPKATGGTSKASKGTSKGSKGTSKGSKGTPKTTGGTPKTTGGTPKATGGIPKGAGTSKLTGGAKATGGSSKSTGGAAKTAGGNGGATSTSTASAKATPKKFPKSKGLLAEHTFVS